MRYDEQKFILAVEDYQKRVDVVRGISILIELDIDNKDAFFSLAPLTRAIHNAGKEVYVIVKYDEYPNIEVLKDIWKESDNLKKGIKNDKTETLKEFITYVNKKSEDKFDKVFVPPSLILSANKSGFKGSIELPFHTEWFKEYRSDEIVKASKKIWKDCYDIKKGELLKIMFEVVPREQDIELPLQDYLDSFALAWYSKEAVSKGVKIAMAASTPRWSMLDPSQSLVDLHNTVMGCELSKHSKEEVFEIYKKLSSLLNLDRIVFPDATFGIRGKGYGGKHVFGDVIGYPSPNNKTRWPSPAGIIYKFDWFPQTKQDERDPLARFGFTSTIPIDIFIESIDIDYTALRRKNTEIYNKLVQCDKIIVKGEKVSNMQTDFEVMLKMRGGKRRWARRSDAFVKTKIHAEYLEREGIKAGRFVNFPDGEIFMTPEFINGRFVGDVVIAIDQSYRIDESKPLVVDCNKEGYKIISGDKDMIRKIKEKKDEAWKIIDDQARNKSIPEEILATKRRCFEYIGEFAINTNPKASLCDYLIVNEKIAKMIHIALGSGYEPDRQSEYHMDIVINAQRQKLDIYGIDEKGNELWILKKGEFVV